ncbi:hypothetical protein [Nocardia sp. N2S4-5]|uniref:hypothetical protein n=1 Tax=Nocardia sp. N2S4-5 TaxID=3351565 RepID=UPI0037CE459E
MSIEISERDADILPRLQRHIPVHTYIGARTRRTNFASVYVTNFLYMYSRTARVEFEEFGVLVGRKHDLIRPPDQEYSRPDYLRGIIDGDGAIGFTARGYPFISLVTASPFIAEHFCAEIASVCGVTRTARRNRRDGCFNVMVANGPAVELARWCYPWRCLSIRRKAAAAREVGRWVAPNLRYGCARKSWTDEEDAEILSDRTVKELAELLGRTESSVGMRRWRLGRSAGDASQQVR